VEDRASNKDRLLGKEIAGETAVYVVL